MTPRIDSPPDDGTMNGAIDLHHDGDTTVDVCEIDRLLHLAANGDHKSWRELSDAHGQRISRMIRLRLDTRVAGRVDVDDVLQETFLEAWQSLPRYTKYPDVPFYLWLRGIAVNKLLDVHRRHLGVQKRDARREVSLDAKRAPETTTEAFAEQLIGNITPPPRAASREELRAKLLESLERMDSIDREVLSLRHFEQLSPAEAAIVLGIDTKAAGMRYIRALRRLKASLCGLSDSLSDV